MKMLLSLGALAVLFTGCADETYVDHGPRRVHAYHDGGPRYHGTTHVYRDDRYRTRDYDGRYYGRGDSRYYDRGDTDVSVNRTTNVRNVRNVRNVNVTREVDARSANRNRVQPTAVERRGTSYRETSATTKRKVKTRQEVEASSDEPERVRVNVRPM